VRSPDLRILLRSIGDAANIASLRRRPNPLRKSREPRRRHFEFQPPNRASLVSQPEISIDDLAWLASTEGERAIIAARDSSRPLHLELASLRKSFGAARASLAISQVELRKRAAKKFGDWSEQLLWTEQLLEQATDREIAAYKATRLPEGGKIFDLCCGAGGDLFSLGARGQVTGFDRSAIALFLAQENARRLGLNVETVCADAQAAAIGDVDAWHIDPDRRASTARTSQLEFASPDAQTICAMLSANPNAAIKTAPADRQCELASPETEMEWIGSRGECRQLVIWSGNLAQHTGQRVATLAEHSGHPIIGIPHEPIEYAESIGPFLHEPHNAVLGAELENTLANSQGGKRIDPKAAYFTSETMSTHPALESYRVLETLPFDLKTLKQWIRARNIGIVEIKKRGVLVDPAKLRKQLSLSGDNTATLLLTPHHGRVLALIASRTP
jgi:SAM-dependent methyltransferase